MTIDYLLYEMVSETHVVPVEDASHLKEVWLMVVY